MSIQYCRGNREANLGERIFFYSYCNEEGDFVVQATSGRGTRIERVTLREGTEIRLGKHKYIITFVENEKHRTSKIMRQGRETTIIQYSYLLKILDKDNADVTEKILQNKGCLFSLFNKPKEFTIEQIVSNT